MLWWVDNDNSNTVQFWEFNLEKTTWLKNYEYKVSFKYDNLTVFAYYQGKKLNENITTRDYFTVYWTAFSQFDPEEIIEFINMYLVPDKVNIDKWFNDFTLKRFDLAMDIKRNIDNWVLNHFKDLNQKWADFYWSEWDVETHYIWAYSVRDNKSFLIRIYNKIADIKKKSLQHLYPAYLWEDNVTRVEIEFRSEMTKLVKFDSLLDNTYLFNLMLRYLKKHTPIFESVKSNHVEKLKRYNKKVSIEELKYNQVVRQRYINAFLWYSKKILKIWACPVDILLRNHVISDLTKEDIAWSITKPNSKWKWKLDCICWYTWSFDIHSYNEWKTKRNELHRLNSFWDWRKWR